ncbi:ABC transporter substrate-binding protein [Terrarubrum flagellatum]|uniref:ABC transporter substrate-binding protein n=1 Tax=Terrirubrum flagellatum TaxID=2895980 RepID=UPI00314523F0
MTPDRRTIVTALAALMGPAMLQNPALAQAARKLVVTTYGGVWEKFWRQSLIPDFVKKSGAEVTLDVGFGRTFTANMRAASKDKPPYSMIMMNEVFASTLRKEGYFDPLDMAKVPNYADLYPIAQTGGGDAAVGMISPIGIGYRTDLVKTPPKRWRDLWENPEFKGKIGLYNIVNSAGKMMVLLAGQMFGKGVTDLDAGFAALGKLGPVLQTDFNMSTMMSSGEIIVAPYDFGEIARLKKQGLPVACIAPEEGLIMWDQTFSVAKFGDAKPLALEYINYILSPETQLLLAREFFVSPVNKKVAVPADLAPDVPISGETMMSKIMKVDWDFVNSKATELTEGWNKSIK